MIILLMVIYNVVKILNRLYIMININWVMDKI